MAFRMRVTSAIDHESTAREGDMQTGRAPAGAVAGEGDGVADRLPGRWRRLGGKGAAGHRTGRAAPVARTALTRAERTGHVVIAGGRVVLGDGRQQVGAGDAARLEVQAATLTLAVAAPD